MSAAEQYQSLFSSNQFDWSGVQKFLHDNPAFVNGSVLCQILRRNAPLEIIEWIVSRDPHLASLPASGPSALQVAVESSCPLPVVETVIKACPLALVATNTGYMDPLTYVKRFRSGEAELIQMLKRPVLSWMPESTADEDTSSETLSYRPKTISPMRSENATRCSHFESQFQSNQDRPDDKSDRQNVFVTKESQQDRIFSSLKAAQGIIKSLILAPGDKASLINSKENRPPVKLQAATASQSKTKVSAAGYRENNSSTAFPSSNIKFFPKTTLPEIQELENVKSICVSVLKGHQRLSREIRGAKNELTESLQHEQDRWFRTQLIALEMKEQHMRAQVRSAQAQLYKKLIHYKEDYEMALEQRYVQLVSSLQEHVNSFQTRLQLLERRVDSKCSTDSKTSQLAHKNLVTTKVYSALDKKKRRKLRCARQSPMVFSTPFVQEIGQHYDDDDDDDVDIRSLLSEDVVLIRKKPSWNKSLRCLVFLRG